MLETFNFNFNAKLESKSHIINNRNESPDARKRNVMTNNCSGKTAFRNFVSFFSIIGAAFF